MTSASFLILDQLRAAAELPAVEKLMPHLVDGSGLDNRITVSRLIDGRLVVLRQSPNVQRLPHGGQYPRAADKKKHKFEQGVRVRRPAARDCFNICVLHTCWSGGGRSET